MNHPHHGKRTSHTIISTDPCNVSTSTEVAASDPIAVASRFEIVDKNQDWPPSNLVEEIGKGYNPDVSLSIYV
jgi:hypothetical protein